MCCHAVDRTQDSEDRFLRITVTALPEGDLTAQALGRRGKTEVSGSHMLFDKRDELGFRLASLGTRLP